MEWTQLSVKTTNEASEAVCNILLEAGAQGVQIDDSDYAHQVVVMTYFTAQTPLYQSVAQLEAKIKNLRQYGLDPGQARVLLENLNDDSWSHEWKKYYQPIRLDRYLTIVPSWTDYQASQIDEKIIRLDPGKAFGTGTHPTTRLALQGLQQVLLGGQSMIDVGAGSGVLSIAAKLLGASKVWAYDVDEEAIKATRLNIALNDGCQDIEVATNDLLNGVCQKVDIVVANILAEVLEPLIPQVPSCLNENGYLILSGIFWDKKELIETLLQKYNFEIIEILQRKEWYGIVAQLKAGEA
ncbi:50S ribosomal protein L11 methyltransferase [Ligilactobacillus sp. Marseille-Q7487]|mgnify:CR=1 FL=1|uniref:50S ribosomal protein L11 methyltransferase n=1 Tax=Ligilactobacillus sp. Marseille-Q7487 TaxID=3022128 RepID=UPI0015B5373B|nr:50S ribosomal protein L11 methyltransferase [Ligilactobacillus sp. Marseille-Q7487]